MATSTKKGIGIFIIAAIVAIAALALTSGVASAAKHVVNQTDPACVDEGDYYYTSIQAAVWNASSGDTIIVCPGRYNETVVVNKSNIVIRSNNGTSVTNISSNTTDMHVVNITDQINVTLDGFEIRDAHGTTQRVAGIYMDNAAECTISNTSVSNVTAYDYAYGIHLWSSHNNNFSGSTSVSNITADNCASGIYLGASNNNRFSSNTSVSTVTSATKDAAGILLGFSSDNTFSSSTSVSTVTSTTDKAYGIWLRTESRDNTFTGVTITPTINGSESYEFFSGAYCADNEATDLTIGNSPTTISFTYGNGVWIKRVNVSERPGDPANFRNIGKYIKASNLMANSWLFVNLSYNESDVAGVFEDTLSVWKHNGTAWNKEGWNGSRVLDTTNNVVGVNINSFCIFAPLGNPFPPTITSFAPLSPVNDTVCTWRTFNVSVNQTVNVSWYLNNSLLFTNESVTEANCTLHAAWPGVHNVSAIATNQNGSVMQTWIWNIPVPPNITSFAPPSPVNDTVCTWRTFNVSVNQTVNVSWYLNNSLRFTNVSVTEANCTLHAAWPGEHNVSAIATNQNGTVTQTWIWNVTGLTSVTIPTATGTGNVKINTSSGYFCDIPEALNASYFPSLPESPITFFHGFFNLSICGLNTTNPETVTINFTFPTAIPTNAEFWKYNSSTGTWYRYDFGDNDGDNLISITVTDNGAGDHNPANGTINDPNGIGLPIAPVPALTPIGMLALIGVLSAIAATTINRRKRR